MWGQSMAASDILEQIKGVEGPVKWFDPRKGFGFIIGPEGQDIFAHFTVIQGEGFRALKDGSIVTYDAVRTDKGWRATWVMKPDSQIEGKRGDPTPKPPRA